MTRSQPDWHHVARLVLLSRELDRLEEEQLAPQGKVKYQFSARGHELSQVLLALALTHRHDAACVYYRSRPFMLASGLTPVEALAAGMARTGSPSQGRDVGVVFNMPKRGGATILPSSGDVGAQYTPAAGWAQAVYYRRDVLGEKDWDGAIATALGGDGSVAANGFWGALNAVTPQRFPMLFFIEDNSYGISVPSSLQVPGGNIAENLKCYGNLAILDASGTDPHETWNAIDKAVNTVRAGGGPFLLRLRVPRLSGHTFIDDQAYKSPKTRAEEEQRDPLPKLRAFLLESGTSEEEWNSLVGEIKEEVQKALAEAESNSEPDPKEATRYIFYNGEAPRQGGLRPENALPPVCDGPPQPQGPRINMVDAVRRALEAEMKINPRLLVFGEDVGVKGGVHGATLDMQSHFGEKRVFDTSLNEDAIIGRSVGMAIAGLLPLPEIQFRKYADPATEQINDLGTLRWRTANNFAAPIVVRIPVGYGKKTGDPWHSVTGEAVYAHTPGWRIAFPSNAEDAVGLLRTALRSDDPTFFFEHRALLDTSEGRKPYPGDDYCVPFGVAKKLLEGDELTIVTWGAMVPRCLEAARPYLDRVTLLDLRTIIPWDQASVLESVRQTGKVLVVHEDSHTTGFGGEILATIGTEAFEYLDAPLRRLSMPDIPVPFNYAIMDSVLPSLHKIRAEVENLLNY